MSGLIVTLVYTIITMIGAMTGYIVSRNFGWA